MGLTANYEFRVKLTLRKNFAFTLHNDIFVSIKKKARTVRNEYCCQHLLYGNRPKRNGIRGRNGVVRHCRRRMRRRRQHLLRIFFPKNNPETVLLIDRWRDRAAINFHHKAPMMKEIDSLRDMYRLKMRVERFTEL